MWWGDITDWKYRFAPFFRGLSLSSFYMDLKWHFQEKCKVTSAPTYRSFQSTVHRFNMKKKAMILIKTFFNQRFWMKIIFIERELEFISSSLFRHRFSVFCRKFRIKIYHAHEAWKFCGNSGLFKIITVL